VTPNRGMGAFCQITLTSCSLPVTPEYLPQALHFKYTGVYLYQTLTTDIGYVLIMKQYKVPGKYVVLEFCVCFS